jgi:hypothetical protein
VNKTRPVVPTPPAAAMRLVFVEAEASDAAIRRLVAAVVRPVARAARPLRLPNDTWDSAPPRLANLTVGGEGSVGAKAVHGLRCASPVATSRGPVGSGGRIPMAEGQNAGGGL